jgi:DNA-binding transcriptional ArsR family regulator
MFGIAGEQQLYEVSQVLKVIADPARLSILQILARGEQSVTQIQYASGISQPIVSRHLSQMRTLRLVEARREGKQVIYSLGPDFSVSDGSVRLDLACGSMSLGSGTPAMAKTVAA